MNDNITPIINQSNVEHVRNLIKLKNSGKPFSVSNVSVGNVVGDMNNFPYQRFYRGVPESHVPIIFERETAWREVDNNYPIMKVKKPSDPEHVWQNTCTIILPPHKDIYSQYEER